MLYINNRDDSGADLRGPASGTVFSKIFGGIVVPLFFLGFGAKAMILQHAVFYGRGKIELIAGNALAFGIILTAIGFLLHFHFIWTVSERLFRLSELAKILALMVFLISFGYLAWQLLR